MGKDELIAELASIERKLNNPTAHNVYSTEYDKLKARYNEIQQLLKELPAETLQGNDLYLFTPEEFIGDGYILKKHSGKWYLYNGSEYFPNTEIVKTDYGYEATTAVRNSDTHGRLVYVKRRIFINKEKPKKKGNKPYILKFPETWICKRCNTAVLATLDACYKCGAPKDFKKPTEIPKVVLPTQKNKKTKTGFLSRLKR